MLVCSFWPLIPDMGIVYFTNISSANPHLHGRERDKHKVLQTELLGSFHDHKQSQHTFKRLFISRTSPYTTMISRAFIIIFLAGNAFVQAIPAKKVSTYSYPETITIKPPTTTRTLYWPEGLLGLPGRTTTVKFTLGRAPHLQARETASLAPQEADEIGAEETSTSTLPFEKGVSGVPVSGNIQPRDIFISNKIPGNANHTATANSTQVYSSPLLIEKVIDSRGPSPVKTVFITITKEPAKSSVGKPRPTLPIWSKGKHCPYPYPGETCRQPKRTKTSSSSRLTYASSTRRPCPYPGQKC